MMSTRIDAVLCGSSALAYWRSHPNELRGLYDERDMAPDKRQVAEIIPPSAATVERIRTLELIEDDSLHLFIGPRENQRRLKGVSCTVCNRPVQRHSFIRALGNIYVVCPEFLYMELANTLGLVELLIVGHELCGSYRMDGTNPVYGVDNLTTSMKLRTYVEHAQGVIGQRKALRSLPWLADNAASPAETALSIMFRLPYRLGGYGLGSPLLNPEIKLNETASRILGRATIRPDGFWAEAKHPYEYDGSMYHTAQEQALYDERRREAYAAMGMSITVIRPRHLRYINSLDDLASTIRKNLGTRQNRLPAGYELIHGELFDELFAFWQVPAHDPARGPLSDDELAWHVSRYHAPTNLW